MKANLKLVETMEKTNVEAEQSLLGLILMNNQSYWKAAHLSPLDFAEPVHQRIFEACKLALEAGLSVSPITLKAQFANDPSLADIGGGKYLMQLAKTALNLHDPKELADELLGTAQRRRLEEVYQEALAVLWESKQPAESVAKACMELEAAVSGLHSKDAVSDNEVLLDIIQRCSETLPAYSTGLPLLDMAMGGGLIAGKAYGFAAPKKSGKTALLATIAENLNQQGIRTLYVALEMGKEQIMERIAAKRINRNPIAFLTKERKEDSFRSKLLSAKTGGNLYFLDYAGISFEILKSSLLRAVRRNKYKVVIIDYWQLVGGKSNKTSEREHLDAIAQWIAEFSKAYKVATITASQVNQDGNTRGGEGMRLAFDQVYKMNRIELAKPDEIEIQSWFEMMDTRYTQWQNIGDETNPAFRINPLGVYFEQIGVK